MKLPFISEKRKHSSKPGKDAQQDTTAQALLEIDYSDDGSVRGLSELYSPEQTSESHTHDITDVLLDMGKITDKQHATLRKTSGSRGILNVY